MIEGGERKKEGRNRAGQSNDRGPSITQGIGALTFRAFRRQPRKMLTQSKEEPSLEEGSG